MFPNRAHPIVSAIVGFGTAICSYHLNLLWHSLRQTKTRYDLDLPSFRRRRAALEFTWNVGVYAAFWAMAGFHPLMAVYLWLQYFAAVTIDGLYITTNHTMTGQAAGHPDPVLQTVSVRIPALIDFVHLRFSHRTEHHLYPNAGMRYYPRIRAALILTFPERYNELKAAKALALLLTCAIAAVGDDLMDPEGQNASRVPFPVAAP